MGRNGAGKTTLLRTLVGLTPMVRGSARVAGHDIAATATETLACNVGFVPQDPIAVLYHDNVEREIADVLAGTGREGTVDDALDEWGLRALRSVHPGDLSAGERQRAALAAMLAGEPDVIFLDEPTRGMDYETKRRLIANLRRRCERGACVVLASHDVELAGSCADRVVLLAEGQVVVDGPAREVLTETLTFSTQINKLVGGRFLTPEDVLAALEGAAL
jgi:energy-coupling factor transport system ATP-binding protein